MTFPTTPNASENQYKIYTKDLTLINGDVCKADN